MTLVVDLQYFSPVIFYFDLSSNSNCILDQYEPYRKMSFRNRCTLSGANGIIPLSMPLVGGRNQKKEMREVKIENREAWQSHHWKTIESCYNKSPFFDHYRDELRSLYAKKFEYLIDWNLTCMKWVCDKMAIATAVDLSDRYIKNYDPKEFIDHRKRYRPATINSLGPALPRYPQVFEDRFGFIPNLSILDKLFCNGGKF